MVLEVRIVVTLEWQLGHWLCFLIMGASYTDVLML